MDEDFLYAQRLQKSFDEEHLMNETEIEKDELYARNIASGSHQLSESEEEDISCAANASTSRDGVDEVLQTKCPSDVAKKPECRFGKECYRKNPTHFMDFSHPEKDVKFVCHKKGQVSADEATETPRKRQKTEESKPKHQKQSGGADSFRARFDRSGPFHFFLNKVYSVPETHKDSLSLVLPDLLHPKLGKLIESCQINFMVDLKYLMNFYEALGISKQPLLVIYGELYGQSQDYPKVICNHVQMPYQYGVHHSKMMMFNYELGFRVVIHTANLVPDDLEEKTQGFWVSPVFPKLESGKSTLLDGDSTTCFKKDLVDYLLSYKQPDLTRWSHIVKSHDFSSCKAIFLSSVPGYHTGGQSINKYGHQKIRSLLRKYGGSWSNSSSSSIVAQCSSIGSLGKDAKSWLSGELGVSLIGGNPTSSPPKVHVIYPSEDDVRNSSQGYGGGSCLPYNSNTHTKQPWLENHLHLWRSELKKRSSSMPHIKTYARLSKDLKKAQYFILTSSNLSKAAWGQLQKQNSQLFIRSYEVGVLLLPKFLTGEDSFLLKTEHSPGKLSLPYDLPLKPYPTDATPWFMNTAKAKPDVLGNKYP